VISPSGRYLALVQRVGSRDRLVVIDLEGRTRTELYNDTTADRVVISELAWKGDERILFLRGRAVYQKGPDGKPVKVVSSEANILHVVDRAGGPPRRLDIKSPIRPLTGYGMSASTIGTYRIFDTLDEDPDHMLMVEGHRLGGGYFRAFPRPLHLQKVNISTGKAVIYEPGEDRTVGWVVDRKGAPILRYDIYGRRGGIRVMGRDPAGKGWRELYSIREKDLPLLQEIEVLRGTDKPGLVYVSVEAKDGAEGDTRELRTYDFTTRTMGEKIWSHPTYDLTNVVVDDEDRLLGACYWAEVYSCHYFDKKLSVEMAAVAKFFDGERNVRISSQSRDGMVQVLSVSGPEEPGSLYLYDRRNSKIELLGPQFPWLPPDRLGVTKTWRWTSRDGVELGGYLTGPVNAQGPLPLIVMPHGGPEARDYFAFDKWAQAFATRGYLVFQPNFRGSGGFGKTFAAQGYGQWGLRMQDDVMDGVQALIRSGQVDPERICIVGASYGGYVALFGGAQHPEIFKCVIARAGLSDLVRSQDWERSTFDADSPRYQYWLKSVGDPKTDREKLLAASPVTYSARYGPPVLLLHGDQDWTVPIEQSEIMERALKKAGKPVRLITYKGEGHGGWQDETEAEALDEMLKFVETHIGPKRTPK